MKKTFFFVLLLNIVPMIYGMEQQNDDDKRKYWDRLEKLSSLTIYKKDLYLERLVGKGIVSLGQIEDIHKEIENGLDYDPDRLDKTIDNFTDRWKCAVRFAPENIKRFIEDTLSGEEVTYSPRCKMILLFGRYGMGKETLARGIVHALGMKQMVVSAPTLIDEEERGTMLNVKYLIGDFSKRSNTALILDDVDCLLADIASKRVNPDSIRPILRPSGHKYTNENHRRNLLICTGKLPKYYPEGFLNEIHESALLESPDADQRVEIIKIMVADRKGVFNEQVISHLKEAVKKLDGCSRRNLQGFVSAVMSDVMFDELDDDKDKNSDHNITNDNIDAGVEWFLNKYGRQ